jgi:DHA1 family bicyclomycin/chloramphenicol resistance-like MFS transporter
LPSSSARQPVTAIGSGQPAESKAARVRLLIILGALSAFGPLSIDMYLPGLPALLTDFNTGASQIQLTLSACLIGLAVGQLVAGPISDTFGRRFPLLIGLVGFAVASVLCAFAPTIGVLIGLRFVQGFAGAAGIVIGRAIVRDMHAGQAAARYFSMLMLVNGSAPILAPIVGGQILRYTSWQGVFAVLALIGCVLFLAAFLGIRETLPPERRQGGGVAGTLRTFRRLATDRSFIGYAAALGLSIAAMFAYISGSPFVLQEIYGVSPQQFSFLFGMNALGIVIAGQINARLIGRVPLKRLLGGGITASTTGGILLLLTVTVLGGALPMVLISLFMVVASLGFIMPNATALALSAHPTTAGSASALLGLLQYLVGALAAPLVGIAGEDTALPMAIIIATLGSSALIVYITVVRGIPEPDE